MNVKGRVELGFYSNHPQKIVSLRVSDWTSGVQMIKIDLTPAQFRDVMAGSSVNVEVIMPDMLDLINRPRLRESTAKIDNPTVRLS